MRVLHVTTPEAWAAGRREGAYTTSTRGRTLAQEGLIHCSQPHQVDDVRSAVVAVRAL